ncbi:MAG: HAD-IIB family hydrolase [Candidatus Wallacebacter cryptica]|jgi:HAD superfamily hydrolase (TIGR01484 family)|nr:HAD-IIB family hydrolase [Bacillota bacterium]
MVSILCDVDGCLVPGRGEMWDFAGLSELAERNHSREFTFALCSSRPAPFLEAVARQLLISDYCICENGALLYHPLTKEAILNPIIPQDFFKEQENIHRILEEIIGGKEIVVEVGKSYTFSVNTINPELLPEIEPVIEERLAEAPIDISKSSRSIEIVPRGINKAEGVQFWCEITNTDPDRVLAIGDTDNDLPMFSAAARSAAPANCSELVRSSVDYVSEYPMVRGVLDIYVKAKTIMD